MPGRTASFPGRPGMGIRWAASGGYYGCSLPELHLSTISIANPENLQVVLPPPPGKVPEAWSADGQRIVYIVSDPPRQSLWTVTLGDGRTPVRLTPDGLHLYDQAQLSPDDRWLGTRPTRRSLRNLPSALSARGSAAPHFVSRRRAATLARRWA